MAIHPPVVRLSIPVTVSPLGRLCYIQGGLGGRRTLIDDRALGTHRVVEDGAVERLDKVGVQIGGFGVAAQSGQDLVLTLGDAHVAVGFARGGSAHERLAVRQCVDDALVDVVELFADGSKGSTHNGIQGFGVGKASGPGSDRCPRTKICPNKKPHRPEPAGLRQHRSNVRSRTHYVRPRRLRGWVQG